MKFNYRLLLLPLSLLYSMILGVRHWLYDLGIFKSRGNFPVPVICIGNLNLGGTGKTPFTEYLIQSLGKNYRIAVLSRGYGRSTKGYVLATESSTPAEIGDEPLQIFRHFGDRISLAVCEDRVSGVNKLLADKPDTRLIILDDAFQHRKISADITILLTPYSLPYFSDYLLPTGNLRDIKSASERADLLIFTKSPDKTDSGLRDQLNDRLKENSWFSRINYLNYRNAVNRSTIDQLPEKLLVVTGIAKPEYLITHLEGERKSSIHKQHIELLTFPDHHKYTEADLTEIDSIFDTFAGAEKAILTTEKDWVKLGPLLKSRQRKDLWIIAPICFTIQEEEDFLATLKQKIADVSASKTT